MVDAGFSLARRYGFQSCGGNAMVWVDKSRGRTKCTCWCCHDRWCQACGRTRRQRLAKALTNVMPGKRCVHLVLTLRSSDRPLRDQVKHLISSYAKLRRRKWWQARAAGGAWTYEQTYNVDTGQWHPHIHSVVECGWMQLQELSEEWNKASGGSHRVHISLVQDNASAIRELSKYVGKLLHRTWEHNAELVTCAMKALNGVRLCGTFGTWRGVQLDVADDPDPGAVWECWGSLDALYELARQRDPEALELLAQLHGRPARLSANKLNARPPPGCAESSQA